MKLLLDTHVLLWAAGSPDRLSADARNLLDEPQNQLFFSAASLWEITIKRGLGRPDFQVDAHFLRHGLIKNGYVELGISGDHALFVDRLPPIHKDPFDRILLAQASYEGITLVTADTLIAQYPGPIRKI